MIEIVAVEDDDTTPKIEITLDNPQKGMCMATVYNSEGQMLSCGEVTIIKGQGAAPVPLGEYENQTGIVIKLFLVDENDAPQTITITK